MNVGEWSIKLRWLWRGEGGPRTRCGEVDLQDTQGVVHELSNQVLSLAIFQDGNAVMRAF